MIRVRLATLVVAVASCATFAPAAHAAFRISSFSASLTDPGTAAAPTVTDQLVAGAHPDLGIGLRFATRQDDEGNLVADGDVRDVHVDLPPGLSVDPTAAPTCNQSQLDDPGGNVTCPPESRIGTAAILTALSPDQPFPVALYNMARPEDAPAQFAFSFLGATVKLNGRVRADGGYSLAADATDIPQVFALLGVDVTLWGVPADPVHDADRFGPSTATPQAFVSNPTSCSDAPQTFAVRASNWRDGAVSTLTDGDEPDGAPFRFTGCDTVPFFPTASVLPTTLAPDSPTGLDVSVQIPQTRSPDRRATGHLRDLTLTLPVGMAVNPSGAAGLDACSPAQIGLGADADATCPDASKLGTVSIATPLLAQPLTGSVFLAKQGDNPFGTLLGLYLVAQGQHVTIKLPGRVDLDPSTGRLVATFAQNPQLPFSRLDVHLDGGARAPLTTPSTCGAQTATVELASWSGGAATTATSAFSIACTPGLGAFAPTFEAGVSQTSAGTPSSLKLDVGRPDGQAVLNQLSLRLPTGLLAKLRGVPRCADAQADAGACDAGSRVGGAVVLAGAGAQPFSLPGDVFLTGPYEGAPFGLAVRVRVLAGPLDLGTVIVRQRLLIDADDTHVTVASDPLPTILQGIPIRLRTLNVSVDRPDFVVNPTSCAAKRFRGTLGAVDGRTAEQSVAFRVGGCADLAFTPRLGLSLRGRRTGLRDGGHPALRAILSQPSRESNLRTARVTLPLSLALDPDNARSLCEAADGAKAVPTCPRSSVVGRASATTPLLGERLTGLVYFVKGQRTDPKTGRIVRTLPTLVVPLGGDGVHITLRARTAVRADHLVTTFERIPDAPVSRFDLSLSGGKHGILVTNGSACRRSRTLSIAIAGQTGATRKSTPRIAAPCK